MGKESEFELFWRNPYNYWRQMQELGETDIAWDRGILGKMNIEPFMFSNIKFSKINPNWRFYIIGQQDTQEFDASCSRNRPLASYPTFNFEVHTFEDLENFLKNPWGDDPSKYNNDDIPIRERPVKGQPHKIFITNMPRSISIEGRKAFDTLEQVNENWREYCTIFLHRSFSYWDMFGRNFGGASVNPRDLAGMGSIQAPKGKTIKVKHANPNELRDVAKIFGYTPEDMEIASNRCLYNMLSARDASRNFMENGRPLRRVGPQKKKTIIDLDAPDNQVALTSPKG